MIRAAAVAAALLAAAPAAAHQLRVFASVEGDVVNVEAAFSNGRLPASGEVRVYDGGGALLMTLPVEADGVTSFPLPDGASEAGLTIEVEAGDGHEDYWLLTPEDIARGQGES